LQDSGCRDASGFEPVLQSVVDSIYNACLEHGGWHITTVIATSPDAVMTQVDTSLDSLFNTPARPFGLSPRPNLCYPPSTRVFTSQHLKMLTGDTLGVAGASKSALALACGFSHFFAEIGFPTSIQTVYGAVKQHPYFAMRIVGWEAWEGNMPGKAAVDAMKSSAASINGELLRCCQNHCCVCGELMVDKGELRGLLTVVLGCYVRHDSLPVHHRRLPVFCGQGRGRAVQLQRRPPSQLLKLTGW
jgi:hypothetical protein